MTRGKWPWRAASILWIVLILYSSTATAERFCDKAYDEVLACIAGNRGLSVDAEDNDRFWPKKIMHSALFIILGYLLVKAAGHSTESTAVYTIALGTVVGISSELVQLGFPSREPAIRDVLINIGSLVTTMIVFQKRMKKKPLGRASGFELI